MFPFELQVVSIPVKNSFRGIKFREIALFEGPAGWSEFSPFIEYDNKQSATWLKASLEAATKPAPNPIRNEVMVNATLPNVKPGEVEKLLSNFDGCTVIKIKINDFIMDRELLIESLKHVPNAKFRLDINGGWTLDEAVVNLKNYEGEFAGLIDYVEQPCLDIADLKALKNEIGLKIAIDESIRKFLGSDLTKLKDVADIAVIKWAPSGGISAALNLIEQISLPVVISSALDSSVGISHGVALACVLPNLYGACGLATVALLEADVTTDSLLASKGVISNRRVIPDRINEFKVDQQRHKWWQDRADVIYEGSLI
ncbi:MAG: o-succinylbenzoate synthase [Actinomycetota bacterium]|nr:o-succinylbenzoate synthase [Actinomycetota bacterium]